MSCTRRCALPRGPCRASVPPLASGQQPKRTPARSPRAAASQTLPSITLQNQQVTRERPAPSIHDVSSACRPSSSDSEWTRDAIRRLRADAHRSSDTHLFPVNLPVFSRHGVDLYLKDESSHPTGSLKHRLARSLIMYGLVNNWIHKDTALVEASSGSTAVSEAYFARMLGLRFIAVMARTVSEEKVAAIKHYGGDCHLVDSTTLIYSEAERLAQGGGYFLNQFKNAEIATDWRGNNNLAEMIFRQMEHERFPEPSWAVVTAGTGGTCTTLGRYLRYRGSSTRLCVADPEGSVFYEAWRTGDRSLTRATGGRVEGIGRPRVEASFMPQLIDSMLQVPDVCTFSMMRYINKLLGRKVGGSTGTNCYAALRVMCDMVARGERGSVVSLICDGGERYSHTYYNDQWLGEQGLLLGPHLERIQEICDTAQWRD